MKTLQQLAYAIDAEYIGPDVAVQTISHDTRTLMKGDTYIALKGERLDGHDFIDEAVAQGAAAVIVSEKTVNINIPHMKVKDTTIALGQMAKVWREQFDLKIAAITGSAGKTTTRNILHAILQGAAQTLLPTKNYNNHWGVPLTLMRLRSDDDYAVLELGANHAGEIAYTVGLTQPDVAVLTNAGASHLEGFGSIDGVARAKAEIFQGLKAKKGTAVLNKDDKFYAFWQQQLESECVNYLSFGLDESADIYATDIQMTGEGSSFTLHIFSECFAVILPLLGVHNVKNALAAVTAAVALKINYKHIINGLAQVKPEPGRLSLMPTVAGVRLIDDTYNASVNAVLSALEVLAAFSGQRIAVLGDMGELGADEISYHRQVGQAARELGIEQLYTVGEKMHYAAQAFGVNSRHFANKNDLVDVLKESVGESPVTMLVKGARAMQMESIVKALQQHNEDVLC
ncbi:UDP-N-acetylmuramoyl-tripeptide--D-alanyl-D-alanine ligase [Piscirickettsia litoralis]|uniref:UDP-N-acetylmuramoyl-tripeptide--D-alanyl-D-alanine ligase n=1 Tax=Piscirickettsia litoralis TaxID=1891921 RepID=A0ABX3A485_9GAMM|nr:UDP-N-acetylmuramoyl-tripeptide--D-alanyl-D-alanine ligase [Piscirickettsia litoralis]ODN43057.1 UDP-N-acetylmuramoyl-tripeptide--D-alanyl-D-alanine ligase [Piscirickettsia litoralis]